MHKPFSCALLLMLAGCVSLPKEVKDRTAFTTFDPQGTYQLVESQFVESPVQDNTLTLEAFKPGRGRPAQTLRVLGGSGKGRALVDGDTVYVVMPQGAEIFVGTPTPEGYEALIGDERLFVEKGRGGRGSFKGHYRVEGIDTEEKAFKTRVDISQQGYVHAMRYDSAEGERAGLGFIHEGRLVAARFPFVVKLNGDEWIADPAVRFTGKRAFAFNEIYLGVFKREGERLVGQVLRVGNKGQPVLGREVLQRIQSPPAR